MINDEVLNVYLSFGTNQVHQRKYEKSNENLRKKKRKKINLRPGYDRL